MNGHFMSLSIAMFHYQSVIDFQHQFHGQSPSKSTAGRWYSSIEVPPVQEDLLSLVPETQGEIIDGGNFPRMGIPPKIPMHLFQWDFPSRYHGIGGWSNGEAGVCPKIRVSSCSQKSWLDPDVWKILRKQKTLARRTDVLDLYIVFDVLWHI